MMDTPSDWNSRKHKIENLKRLLFFKRSRIVKTGLNEVLSKLGYESISPLGEKLSPDEFSLLINEIHNIGDSVIESMIEKLEGA